MIIDTHCHIDMYPNPLQVLNECEKRGISVISMTSLPSHFELGYNHFKDKKKVRQALGYHPLLIDEYTEIEIAKFESLVNYTSYIGEIGLDFSKEGYPTKDIQLNTFKKILNSLMGKKKILSIHSRKAEREVLELLIEYKVENAIFHWYSGPVSLIEKICESGYYLSVNPAMVQSKSGKETIKKIPRNKILTESDGPFIQVNGKDATPMDVEIVIAYLSEIWELPILEVSEIIHFNFFDLLNKIR